MKKIIHGIEHGIVHGLTTSNLIEQLRPDIVLIESKDLSKYKETIDEINPITETCNKLDIGVVPIDKKLGKIKYIKCLVHVFITGIMNIGFMLLMMSYANKNQLLSVSLYEKYK